MRLLSVRGEEPPGDTIVIVRGGEMNSEYVRRSAAQSFDEFGFYGVSVFAALDLEVAELCRAEPMLARYGRSDSRPSAAFAHADLRLSRRCNVRTSMSSCRISAMKLSTASQRHSTRRSRTRHVEAGSSLKSL
jgi:hypothetical protein